MVPRTRLLADVALVLALLASAACSAPPSENAVPATPTPSHPEQKLLDELVLANRMLASQELGFLDAYGHVSVRSGRDRNHYFISRYVSPGIVTAGDIIENDLDSRPIVGERSDQYNERFLHGELYKARPDVMAIVHSHTPEPRCRFGLAMIRRRSSTSARSTAVGAEFSRVPRSASRSRSLSARATQF
jgi:hypothetical protein